MRISFDERDAAEIYEWRLAIKQIDPDMEHCASCKHIEDRLRNCIGRKEAKRLQDAVRKNPYKA